MPTLNYQNPLTEGYFADPFVWRHDELYFAIGTGATAPAPALASGQATVFPMLTSPDLGVCAADRFQLRPAPPISDFLEERRSLVSGRAD